MSRKFAAGLVASAMLITATAAQAGPASALSLRNSPVISAHARASTASARKSNILPFSPLALVIGAVAVVGVLEATKVINIIHDKPKSP